MEKLKVTSVDADSLLTAFGISEERADIIGNRATEIMEDRSVTRVSDLIAKAVNEIAENPNEAAYIAFTLGKFIGHSDAMESMFSSMIVGKKSGGADDELIEALMKNKPTAQA